jgi:hypothetical protein
MVRAPLIGSSISRAQFASADAAVRPDVEFIDFYNVTTAHIANCAMYAPPSRTDD